MGILQHIFALAHKEFLAVLRDKRSRFVLIGPPIVQLLVFGYAATFDLNSIPLGIFNEDNGSASRELVSHFQGSPHFKMIKSVERDAEITSLIDSRQTLIVLHIGPRFSAKMERGDNAPVQVIVDGRNSNTAMLALNYVRSIVLAFNHEWSERKGRSGPPAHLQVRAWFNPNLESRWFIVPGIVGLLTLVVTLVITALSVAREREAGTFDQLLVTPLRPTEILIGKALPGMVIGIIEGSFIILLAVLWFDIPLRGGLGALYLGLVLFLLSAVGVGLMISSLAVTQQQGLLGAFLFLVPAVILSGFATPIANMPQVVQALTYLDPLRYFLIVLRRVFLEGSSAELLIGQYWPMAMIGLCSLIFAGWRFRHRM